MVGLRHPGLLVRLWLWCMPAAVVGLFWTVARSAWLATLGYQAWMLLGLFWHSDGRLWTSLGRGCNDRWAIATTLGCASSGVFLALLWPWVVSTLQFTQALQEAGLIGWSWWLWAICLCLFNPALEEL